MKLHEDTKLFRQAIQITAEKMGLLPIYIEKDYWVTYSLKLIFKDEIGAHCVFKGGTSLSKCFNLIHRFSEDIDIAMLRLNNESHSQLTRQLKKVTKALSANLPEKELEGITNKSSNMRKTAHEYQQAFQGDFGQVRDKIILEVSQLGIAEPYTTELAESYIYQTLKQTHHQVIQRYELEPFKIKVLDKRKTFCEKIVSLIRFSYDPNPIEALSNKIRHTYDLHQLLQLQAIQEFLVSDEFQMMLTQIAHNDRDKLPHTQWLSQHLKESLLFKETEITWQQLKSTYTQEFAKLVYGDLPQEKLILQSLKKISQQLQTIHWELK